MSDLVSILIPCFNHEKYVGECLDSTIKQTYNKLELIITDDGSVDSSAEIIQRWIINNSKRFDRIVFEKTENRGITRTLSAMLSKARGSFITVCASDDRLTEESIALRVAELKKNVHSGMVFGCANLIDSNGLYCAQDAASYLYHANTRNFRPSCITDELFFRWSLVGPVSMYRAETLVKAGGFDTRYEVEDRNLFLRLTLATKICYINKPVADYRYHPASVTRSPISRLRILTDVANCQIDMAPYFHGLKYWFLISYKVDHTLITLYKNGNKISYYLLMLFKALRKGLSFTYLQLITLLRK